MNRIEQILRIITLSGWLILFQHLLGTPTGGEVRRLGYFLNPALWWLIAGGLAMTILLLGSELFSIRRSDRPFRPAALGQNLILILPLLFYLPAQNLTLSSSGFGKRLTSKPDLTTLQNDSSGAPNIKHGNNGASVLETEKTRIMEFPLSYLIDKPQNYVGKETKIKGMVFYNDVLPDATFLCIRLLVTCCLADASPKGILISYDGSIKRPPEFSWVLIKGKYIAITRGETDYLGIEANALEIVEEPRVPYLYR
ncbi:MAG: hypothetical protein OEV64_09285 [Desulfobulbaceae bacterium]|nr:hypothetical protein [Desulfobulbaceae bacterium]